MPKEWGFQCLKKLSPIGDCCRFWKVRRKNGGFNASRSFHPLVTYRFILPSDIQDERFNASRSFHPLVTTRESTCNGNSYGSFNASRSFHPLVTKKNKAKRILVKTFQCLKKLSPFGDVLFGKAKTAHFHSFNASRSFHPLVTAPIGLQAEFIRLAFQCLKKLSPFGDELYQNRPSLTTQVSMPQEAFTLW